MKSDLRRWVRLVESGASATSRLVDLYTAAELRDDTELIGRLGMEYGNMFWGKACAFPLPVREVAAEYAAAHWNNRGRSIKVAFRKHATKQQTQLVVAKAKAFEGSRIVVMDGNEIIDGNHHVMAAIRAGQPIKYVDLADLPEDI